MIVKYLFTALVSSLFIAGCANIQLSEGGEKARVLAPDDVTSCKKLGESNATVTAKFLGLVRSIDIVEKELAAIGRNSAAKMGGDTIVPLTVIEDGKQSFIVYKCINPGS